MWTQQIGTSEIDAGVAVAVSFDGYVYVAGYVGAGLSLNGQPSAGIEVASR